VNTSWQKSSYSAMNGNCLEVAWHKSSYGFHEANCLEAAWRKSPFCASGECAEAALRGGTVLVRDSKDPDGPILQFTPQAWQAFIRGVDD
jgi:Domain of unknown function (DUF397)